MSTEGMMQRINAILKHNTFKEYMQKNADSEKDRQLCKHDIIHALDVARIAHIINLEEGHGFSKELIYAAALLHDITKWKQYLQNICHAKSAITPAAQILKDCGFYNDEIDLICHAIMHHRKNTEADVPFSNMLFRADKLSRLCQSCISFDECNLIEKNTLLSY